MIVVKLQGGLGNQIFQYAFARAISQRNGVEFALDTQALENGEGITKRHYALEPFAMNPRLLNPEESLNLTKEYSLYKEDYRSPQEQMAAFPRDNCYFNGYWQNEAYFRDFADNIRSDLGLRLPISERAQNFRSDIKAGPSIAVQVRRGDYVSNKKVANILGAHSRDYYIAGVQKIVKVTGATRAFIFSDDIDWCKTNLHFGIEAIFVSGNGLYDHEELHLLGSAEHAVISNSSFGWWGAWLIENSNKMIVAPRFWYRDPKMNERSPVLPEWIQI